MYLWVKTWAESKQFYPHRHLELCPVTTIPQDGQTVLPGKIASDFPGDLIVSFFRTRLHAEFLHLKCHFGHL